MTLRSVQQSEEDVFLSVFSFLYRLTENEQAAEKLANETIMGWSRVGQLRSNEAAMVRLYRDAKAIGLKYLRTSQPWQRQRPEEERVQTIKNAIRRLPEQQRLALILNRYEHLSANEIGQILELNEAETRLLLFQAYKTLGDELRRLNK